MNRLLFLVLSVLCAAAPLSAREKPKMRLDASQAEWFRDAKFGMFIHWGLYSQLEGSYNGRTLPDTTSEISSSWYAEWIEPRLEVPHEEYRGLMRSFNPTKFDADAWIRTAKEAGMRYFIITSKHHDGFALWNSDVSDYNVTQTPYGKDLIAPLVAACKKYGLRYGFYYSHWQDWDYPGGALPYWKKSVSEKAFEKYWKEKSLPQVKELIQRYDPDLLWFDTWPDEDNNITPRRRDELIALVRSLSDKCLINGRICFQDPGEDIDFLEMMDNKYPDKMLEKPWQTPATMQKSFAYNATDFNWKSTPQMLEFLVSSIAKGGNYLLNIGPKADGTFPTPSVRRLKEISAWTSTNAEAVYGTRPVVGDSLPPHVYLTQKKVEGQRYVYLFLSEERDSLTLKLKAKGACHVLESGRPIPYAREKDSTVFTFPKDLFADPCPIVIRIPIED